MRKFVKNALVDMVKKPTHVTASSTEGTPTAIESPAPALPQQTYNRRQRRGTAAVLRGASKQLAKQGIRLEMGKPDGRGGTAVRLYNDARNVAKVRDFATNYAQDPSGKAVRARVVSATRNDDLEKLLKVDPAITQGLGDIPVVLVQPRSAGKSTTIGADAAKLVEQLLEHGYTPAGGDRTADAILDVILDAILDEIVYGKKKQE